MDRFQSVPEGAAATHNDRKGRKNRASMFLRTRSAICFSQCVSSSSSLLSGGREPAGVARSGHFCGTPPQGKRPRVTRQPQQVLFTVTRSGCKDEQRLSTQAQ